MLNPKRRDERAADGIRKKEPLRDGAELRQNHISLAFGVPDSRRGTLFALSTSGGISVPAKEGRILYFGRGEKDVHVPVGKDDTTVSRQHAMLTYLRERWWLDNIGQLPIRLPASRLFFPGEDPIPLAPGYTPVFLQGSARREHLLERREHLLELYVVGSDGEQPRARPGAETQPPRIWRLSPEEKLVLVVLGQRYLRHDAHPQPLTYRQAHAQLHELRREEGWTEKRVEHLIVAVRNRLSRGGVPGLTREEVGEPVGNMLNHNLLRELMLSTSLVPPDLAPLDHLDDD